jgi:hypothetical protein
LITHLFHFDRFSNILSLSVKILAKEILRISNFGQRTDIVPVKPEAVLARQCIVAFLGMSHRYNTLISVHTAQAIGIAVPIHRRTANRLQTLMHSDFLNDMVDTVLKKDGLVLVKFI